MLTGDKLETAINIGFSCKVLDQDSELFQIDQTSKQEIMSYITGILRNINIYQNRIKAGQKLPEL